MEFQELGDDVGVDSLHGVPIEIDSAGAEISLAACKERDAIRIMSEVVMPRPVAWVLSDNGYELDAAERWNLAPFSYFNGVCSDPPLIMLSIGLGMDPRGFKDTHQNLIRRKHFVIHIPTKNDIAAVVGSSAPLAPHESELAAVGLQTVPWGDWPVPRLDADRIALACTLFEQHELGDGRQQLLLAEVVKVRIPTRVLTTDGQWISGEHPRPGVAVASYSPLGMLGLGFYGWIEQQVYAPRSHAG